jgi:hypothetical protein
VYSVRLESETSPSLQGLFFPVLVDPLVQLLELQRWSGLQENQVYEAEITAIGTDGETVVTLFSKSSAGSTGEDYIIMVNVECTFRFHLTNTACPPINNV